MTVYYVYGVTILGGWGGNFVNWYTRCFVRELQIYESVVLYMMRLLRMFGGSIWRIIDVIVDYCLLGRYARGTKKGSFSQSGTKWAQMTLVTVDEIIYVLSWLW